MQFRIYYTALFIVSCDQLKHSRGQLFLLFHKLLAESVKKVVFTNWQTKTIYRDFFARLGKNQVVLTKHAGRRFSVHIIHHRKKNLFCDLDFLMRLYDWNLFLMEL